MLIASEDPLNFILASIWSLILFFCLWLTWYAYLRWKHNPNSSLSHKIAIKFQEMRVISVVTIALSIGFIIGFVTGIFSGHWFWPVELAA